MARKTDHLSKSVDVDEDLELRITPLIDTVFLLLIFFILTSEQPNLERTLELNLVRAAPQAAPADGAGSTLVVTVGPDCRVVVDGRALSLEEFKAALKNRIGARAGGVTVAVQGDEDAQTACIVRVLDICAEAGVRTFGLTHGR